MKLEAKIWAVQTKSGHASAGGFAHRCGLWVLTFLMLPLLCMIFPSTGFADTVNKNRELDRLSLYSRDVKTIGDLPGRQNIPEKEKREIVFGRQFLSDAQAMKGIEIVEPLVETDNYDDPKLQAYVGRCPKLELRTALDGGQIEARFPKEWNRMSLKEKKQIGNLWTWTRGFRIYEISMKGRTFHILREEAGYVTYPATEPSNDDWKKVLDEKKKNPTKPVTSVSDYRVVDLAKCRNYGTESVSADRDYRKEKPEDCTNGILKYQGKYFIYSACNDSDDSGKIITLHDLTSRKKKDSTYDYHFYLFWQLKKGGK